MDATPDHSERGRHRVELSFTGIVILIALFWLAWVPLPYEQDQIAKAGKVIYMESHKLYLSPQEGPVFYRDELFSLYYMLQSSIHAVFRSDVFLEMNLAAAAMGTLFFLMVASALRTVFNLPAWLTGLLALNTPAFLQVFSYGNESAYALVAFGIAFLWLVRPTLLRSVAAGVVLGLGFHCRSDVCFLGPFLCGWIWHNRKRVGGHWWRAFILFGVSSGLTAVAFWLVFVRLRPQETGFNYGLNLKLLAALLVYPFGPGLLAVGFLGVFRNFWKRWETSLVFLLLLLPLAFYVRTLTSPKYIAFMVVPLWLAAGAGLWRGNRIVRVATAVVVGAFWFCSFTPFGLYGGTRGAMWYLPTDDGPAPTGSYLQFYRLSHNGFFQERYQQEMKQVQLLSESLDKTPNAIVTGFFNIQSEQYVRALRAKDGSTPPPMFTWISAVVSTNRPYYLIQTSFLRWNTFDAGARQKLEQWFRHGQLRPVISTPGAVFPEVIETGDQIPEGQNLELGARILFAVGLSDGTGYVEHSRFEPDLRPTLWLPVQSGNPPSEAVYRDSSFACFTNAGWDGTIYSTVMPLKYYSQKDPRPQTQPH